MNEHTLFYLYTQTDTELKRNWMMARAFNRFERNENLNIYKSLFTFSWVFIPSTSTTTSFFTFNERHTDCDCFINMNTALKNDREKIWVIYSAGPVRVSEKQEFRPKLTNHEIVMQFVFIRLKF